MAGGATPTSSAGHPSAGANTTSKLTFKSDHQSGAGHKGFSTVENRDAPRMLSTEGGETFINATSRRVYEIRKSNQNSYGDCFNQAYASRDPRRETRYT